jgi:hypothetical protein
MLRIEDGHAMRSSETRKATAQLPLTGVERLSHRSAPRSTALKEEMKEPSPTHHVASLNSSHGLIMLCGHPATSKIALQALVDRALSGHPVVYLDGAHTFDTVLFERLVRSRRQQPRKVLALIHVARAFSARQLERLISQCLVAALERYQADTAVISGLLESLSADDLTDKEVNRLTEGMIESVRHLTLQGFSLLCPCPRVPIPMAPTYRLFDMLCSMSTRCTRVCEIQGKVVMDELFDTTLAYKSSEGIVVDSPSPSDSPAGLPQFGAQYAINASQ